MGLALAVRFARRELRGGLKGFRVFLACLTLGVAAIAGVGSLSTAILEGIRDNGRVILGGDVDLRLSHRPASAAERRWLDGGATIAEVLEMRTMARAATAKRTTLVEIKAVDGPYPLFGDVLLDGGGDLAAAIARREGRWGAVVEPLLMRRLGLAVGDGIKIGELVYQVRGVLRQEPDRAAGGIAFGPRVLMSLDSMAATGLVRLGSLIHYHYHVQLPPTVSVAAWTAAVRDALPDAGWRIRSHADSAPGLRQFVERLTIFLTLVGLSALLVGGVGVGNAVHSYLDSKTATIATLKCLGAPGGLIFNLYLVQVLMLAFGGIVAGLAIGAVLPLAAMVLLAEVLPVPVALGFYPAPLLLAALYGVLVAVAFALWPLGRAREVAAAGLFRHIVAPARRWPKPVYVLATVATVAALAAIAILTTEERRFAVWFVFGAAGTFVALHGAAAALMALARRAGRPRLATLRLALANLHRPGAPTGSVVLSLGIGLTLLVTVASIEGNMSRQINERLPEAAPAFYFVDIQKEQLAPFLETTRGIPGVGRVDHVPMLRGRITAIDGVPTDQIVPPPEARWVLRGDRGLTYAALPPANSEIVAGKWWPADYQGPPLVSFEASSATALGLEIGDTVTVSVFGREFTATIANLRRVDWTTLGINFVMVFDPVSLAAAPHAVLATAKADGAAEEALFDAVTDGFANVTVVRMKEALELVNDMLAKIGAAIRVTAVVTLFAGILVLAGAMATGHRHRVYDAVVLKVLGATRRHVMAVYLVEYALLGLITAAIAALAGSVAGWYVLTQVMSAEWTFLPGTVAATALSSVAVTVALGLAGTWRALAQKAAPILRTE